MSSLSPTIIRLAQHLQSCQEQIIVNWSQSVEGDARAVVAAGLTHREFKDHIPQILRTFGRNLRALSARDETADPTTVEDAAEQHGAHRWQQGYGLAEMVREWEHLNLVVLDEIEAFTTHTSAEPAIPAPDWALVRRTWAETIGEGVSASASRFDELSRHEAKSKMHDLESTLDKIRVLERERGEILRQASHDMRGSMTVVQGAASLLDWDQLQSLAPAQRNEVIKMLNAGIGALSQMMSDMLDLSRLEAGQEKRSMADFDAGALLQELGQSVASFAAEKSLALQIEGPSPFMVRNDASKVRRIAQNLLLNAIKYTDEGQVRLTWRLLETGNPPHWELIIADTGCGLQQRATDGIVKELAEATQDARAIGASIPSPDAAVRPNNEPECKPKSEPQGEPEGELEPVRQSSIVSGEGVGLSIVKRLCGILEATLELDTASTGSTFRVVFPLSY